jgi:hypothetical protein
VTHCDECARLHGLIEKAIAVIKRGAGGTVAACLAILQEARRG